MNIPQPILDALPADHQLDLATDGRECAGSKHHSPRPLVLHRVRVPAGEVWLCGCCRDSLAVLALVRRSPWTVLRCFGNRIRLLLDPRVDTGTRRV